MGDFSFSQPSNIYSTQSGTELVNIEQLKGQGTVLTDSRKALKMFCSKFLRLISIFPPLYTDSLPFLFLISVSTSFGFHMRSYHLFLIDLYLLS